ncbi:TIGR02117 family protein [Sinorhizobium sp. 7-81]|uniref:TIGR02117 family protein n=1 Tax=Sinorhizobium sp. 8-89 TaxID=3049089 RepID=UPI0024C2450D|nr:TIGR02117 family protein [Sinorhizobium sp. 8-89]MDK1489929.1 TIGR02117 family protein [Sinorhizobium sp. 8-89]
MKRTVKRVFAAVVLLLLAVACGALIPRPFMPVHASSEIAGSRRILLLSGPIHTDIAIPLDDELRARFDFVESAGVPLRQPDVQWLIFGWGGRAFYLETPTRGDLKPLPVLRALSLDRSVMHVDIAARIVESQASVAGFEVDDAGFERLVTFISDSFRREAGQAVSIRNFSYGPDDRFFEARGYFNALFGCNTWTASALRSAGIRTGFWNPFPATLGVSLGLYN